mgnify:CR=1 FL=1
MCLHYFVAMASYVRSIHAVEVSTVAFHVGAPIGGILFSIEATSNYYATSNY